MGTPSSLSRTWLASLALLTFMLAGDSRLSLAMGQDSPSKQSKTDSQLLELDGLSFTVPKGWMRQPQDKRGPMSPKAVFTIPGIKAEDAAGTVRITHFPTMKGKNDLNIQRWLGQVTKADGRPSTRKDATITKVDIGEVRLTIVDLSGSVRITMRQTPKPDHRLIACILDHPREPHFVVVAGGKMQMKRWQDEIHAFLRSAKVKSKG